MSSRERGAHPNDASSRMLCGHSSAAARLGVSASMVDPSSPPPMLFLARPSESFHSRTTPSVPVPTAVLQEPSCRPSGSLN